MILLGAFEAYLARLDGFIRPTKQKNTNDSQSRDFNAQIKKEVPNFEKEDIKLKVGKTRMEVCMCVRVSSLS